MNKNYKYFTRHVQNSYKFKNKQAGLKLIHFSEKKIKF